ncbi:MAG: beta-ketoacyl-[acyl-carrier-protein] synthase family protein [Syntrophobacterales bacterium]|jgi:3-oxoacyl-[acyl-carrier-protein] synthase-1/3-oxoacyl-[acyl-carrier-protein] synthase II|nr:beta-ketoacyl-[acyl-carrier-protein] synthase family protein [Syntrophobacterales bacterium]
MNELASVPITGVGCLCGAGGVLRECLNSLFEGRRSPKPPKRFTGTHSIPYPVFEVPDAAVPGSMKDASHISFTGKFAITAAQEALSDAWLDQKALEGKKVGVCVGTTVGSAMNNELFYSEYLRTGTADMKPIVRFLRSNPAQLIALKFGLTGPCQTVVNACSSGTDAVGIGASWIQSGLCDVVVAGGADELCHVTYNGFISLLITDESACKPFDRERKGLNLGEGAAMLVLESEHFCRERKKTPRARFLGYASASDAYHLTAPHPEGDGLRRAIMGALRFSKKDIRHIAFVNAHGTATPDNDKVEGGVLRELLPGIPFFSTKGYTGHTLGAAGAIEAAFTVACLELGIIPGNAGFANPDPEIDVSPTTVTTRITGSAAISQSLAFGGSNGVLVLGKTED